MSPIQGKVLILAGVVVLLNTLYPPVLDSETDRAAGRNWFLADSKLVDRTITDKSGALSVESQKTYVRLDLERLIMSDSALLGVVLVLLGLGTERPSSRRSS